ncbi:MAG: hypothetical protein KKF54_04635 [Candidatus Omnitrophica bacterium]|nr:hypothetical protein [Candidatus Omnitrophota bacterium]
MTSIHDEAQDYKPPQTKNIADLEVVTVDTEIRDKEYRDSEGNPFTVKVMTRHGEDYRVPVTVLKALKSILEEKPNLKAFKVKKTGEGLKTEYTVVPLD